MNYIRLLIIFPVLFLSGLSFAQNDEQKNQSSSLKLVQTITVTIGGNFIVNGSFTASAIQRVDHFVTQIFLEANSRARASIVQYEMLKKVDDALSKYPLRDITLKRASGETIKIDLLKYRLTGDLNINPYLKNDDVLIFPAYDEEKNFIDISGAVNKPTKFQFVDGDKLSDAILFAGGINPAYDNVTTAEISRLNAAADKEEIITVAVKNDFVLRIGDRIRILADENQKKNYKVLVLGEVKFPGFVYVTKDGLLLSDVIGKAGGFKSNADLKRAEVIRNFTSIEMLRKYQLTEDYLNSPDKLLLPETQLKIKQQKEILEILRLSNLKEDDSIFFSIDNQLRVLRAESLVDFSKLNDHDSEERKFIVKDGDLILVPDKFDYVYVFGQVPKAGYIKHDEGKNYKYYIEQAGGLAETARTEDNGIVVIKGKEKNWITKEKEKLNIEPGDFIYVPKEVPRSFDFYLKRISSVASIVGSVATIILLLVQFQK